MCSRLSEDAYENVYRYRVDFEDLVQKLVFACIYAHGDVCSKLRGLENP